MFIKYNAEVARRVSGTERSVFYYFCKLFFESNDVKFSLRRTWVFRSLQTYCTALYIRGL